MASPHRETSNNSENTCLRLKGSNSPISPLAAARLARNTDVSPSTSVASLQLPSGTATPLSSQDSSEKGSRRNSDDDEPDWPTEWRAWGCLLGCFLLMFNSWGLVNAFGTYLSYYMDHLTPRIDTLLLNLIGSTQSFVVLILSFLVGRILDAGYTRPLLGVGTVLITLGMFLISVVNGDANRGEGSYPLLWTVQGLIVGLGMACFFVSSSQIAATWFIKRKAVAIGIVASGASIAGLVYPIATKFLISDVGFNNAVRYVSTITGVTTIMSFFLAVPNPRHPFRKMKKQQWLQGDTFFDREAFREPAFIWFTAAICFVFFGFYAVFFNLEEWAASHGFGYKGETPPAFSGVGTDDPYAERSIRTFWLLSIMNACSTFGRILSSIFCERFGALKIHFISTAIGALLIFVLWIPATTLGPAVAFCIIWGAISGAIIGMPPASMANILGRADPERQARLGQWTGMMYSTSAVFALTGPVIAGHLVTKFGNYLTCQAWAGASLTCAAFCMGIAHIYLGKGRSLQKLRAIKGSVASTLSFSHNRDDPSDDEKVQTEDNKEETTRGRKDKEEV